MHLDINVLLDVISKYGVLIFLVEAVVQWFKTDYRNKSTYLAMTVGLLVAVAADVNLLKVLGYGSPVPYFSAIIGYLLTGFVFCRASNIAHDKLLK
jgi:riboflavin transporter FmnP